MTSNTVFAQNLNSTLILAHRGAFLTSRYPENTLAAFRSAVEQGANGFELDVRLSMDGEIVVFHDKSFQRLMGVGDKVSHLNYSGIRKLRFLNLPKDTKTNIPSLKEIFQEFGKSVVYNIEVKASFMSYGEIIDRLGNLIRKFKMEQNVWVSCFDPLFLYFWNKKIPFIPTGYLFESWNWVTQFVSRTYFIIALHPAVSLLKYHDEIISYKKPICYWTVNTEPELKFLSHRKVAGIITDNLPLTKKIVSNG